MNDAKPTAPNSKTVESTAFDGARAKVAREHSTFREMLKTHRSENTTESRDDTALVEAVAKALWRWHHPEDEQFSAAAPNDWDRWPETPRQASLAYEDWSRQEFRDQARVAIAAMDALNV